MASSFSSSSSSFSKINNTSLNSSTTSTTIITTKKKKRKGWGSLRPPTAADFKNKKRKKNLPTLTHLVVLDFEWTADNRQKVEPISEITQFPSVLVKLDGPNSRIIDEFNTYVRPVLNPTLTKFSIELTGITQQMVNNAPTLPNALDKYLSWLKKHNLINKNNERVGKWYITTWSDADISQLAKELMYKKYTIPKVFDRWIDLKVLFRRHYKTKDARGLQKCVERLGMTFDGRAHDGLIDSRNTAKIVLHMHYLGAYTYGSFTFKTSTRGLDKHGFVYGSRESQKEYARRKNLEKNKEEGARVK